LPFFGHCRHDLQNWANGATSSDCSPRAADTLVDDVTDGRQPFQPGSVAVLLSPHDLPVAQVVEEMLHDARLVAREGFDGFLISEHHAGLPGYIPNPLQFLGWALGETQRVWGAPCPLLLPLRPTGIVAEEAAWLAVRFPTRVGIGVAVGAAPADFEISDVPFEERSPRYRAALGELVRALSGAPAGALADDAAIRHCRDHPVPVVSATTTKFGVRVAAAAGAGIMLDGLSPLAWSVELADAYRAAGGRGPVVLSRRAWFGEAPSSAAADDVQRYQSFTPGATHQRITAGDSMIAHHDADELSALLAAARDATLADCLSLRLNLPGIGPETVREQIVRFGGEVVPRIRQFHG
jgi:alkanesulfonate monooxygenase SsuD/methylene tetrahydromethanopterin reductase-like flavin-dependent oxidoreductase (luciferase family)